MADQTPPRESALPDEFADLEHFVPDWALPSEERRFHRLHSVRLEELRGFYDAMLPRLPAILDYLGRCKLSALPRQARTLFDLAMTYVETSHPIDLGWKDTDFPGAYRWQAFEFRSISQRSRAESHPATLR
ncbi:hypothetical protein [Bordetella sp. BOR01]|uniref:hypothetical protein n=1 Tax=Bordetella sp. BOR01 TaxID=2854779 RepID=UPI001C4939F8|nr:hypothetical protein [Bordetella sp. BOR01]MBV7483847.1 hypothetical protein [Bordetella sp. BOR01]